MGKPSGFRGIPGSGRLRAGATVDILAAGRNETIRITSVDRARGTITGFLENARPGTIGAREQLIRANNIERVAIAGDLDVRTRRTQGR